MIFLFAGQGRTISTRLGSTLGRAIETLQFSIAVLEWAARQAGDALSDVASKISRKPQAITEGKMTPAQAEKFAQVTNVPFGFLFLNTPPDERAAPIADFRTVLNREQLGREFFDVFDDIEYKRSWLLEHLRELDSAPLSFVGKFQGRAVRAEDLAADIVKTLDLSTTEMRAAASSEALYAVLVERIERVGILVFKNGVVGNNTHRPLSVDQFRGFAIVDTLAPVIFINGADAKAAWLFTLMHEVAHVWLGNSGISDTALTSHDPIEVLCNATAAEILVPLTEFLGLWDQQHPLQSSEARIQTIRRHFKVSALVVARRAVEQKLISEGLYQQIYANARKAGTDSNGGDFYRTMGARNSKRFALTVSALANAGELGLRQASRLLNTSPSNVLNYRDRQSAVSA